MLTENQLRPELEKIRTALDGTDAEIKSAIGFSQVFIRLTAGGNPKQNFSNEERIIMLFNRLSSNRKLAARECSELCKELFGFNSDSDDLKTQMRLLIETVLEVDKPSAGPFG